MSVSELSSSGRNDHVLSNSGQTAFLGIDVGTSSARAGVFDDDGRLVGAASFPIQMWREAGCAEQSSTDIWHAICSAVQRCCQVAGLEGSAIRGIGVCATCSLVAVGPDDEPVTVSHSGDTRRNVIVWLDHRATDQARRINSTNHSVLKYAGGSLSPEMEPPKLLWVKENLPESWAMAAAWMDLGDWITYRATGDATRSLCTTVCKWTYLGHAHGRQVAESDSAQGEAPEATSEEATGWDNSFWEAAGLKDLTAGNCAKIGQRVACPGFPLGAGLTALAAQELGLLAGTPVGSALIDAHAGGLGSLQIKATWPKVGREEVDREDSAEDLPVSSAFVDIPKDGTAEAAPIMATTGVGASSGNRWPPEGEGLAPAGGGTEAQENLRHDDPTPGDDPREDSRGDICRQLALVCGTSTCHMMVSEDEVFVPGVWGPFWSAMVPNLWLTEGGQSATGALLDHLIDCHVAAPRVANRAAGAAGVTIYDALNATLDRLSQAAGVPFPAALTRDIHVLPDFHGNRSPLADPDARGVISGLRLDDSEEDLALLYLAATQSIAYGTRQIIERCRSAGHKIEKIIASGGLAKNRCYLQTHADITGCQVALPREAEPVLLGSAMLGAVASKHYASVRKAMGAMGALGLVFEPSQDERVRKYHDAKYEIFKELYERQVAHREKMAAALL